MRIFYKCKLDFLEKAEYWMIGQICVIKTGGLLSRAKKGIEPLLRQINFLLDPRRLLSLVEIEAFLDSLTSASSPPGNINGVLPNYSLGPSFKTLKICCKLCYWIHATTLHPQLITSLTRCFNRLGSINKILQTCSSNI